MKEYSYNLTFKLNEDETNFTSLNVKLEKCLTIEKEEYSLDDYGMYYEVISRDKKLVTVKAIRIIHEDDTDSNICAMCGEDNYQLDTRYVLSVCRVHKNSNEYLRTIAASINAWGLLSPPSVLHPDHHRPPLVP